MNDLSDDRIGPCVRTMQIIAFSLITGVVTFLGIACFMVFGQPQAQPPAANALPILSIMAAVMFAGMAPMSYVLPLIMTQASRQKIAAGTWQSPPGMDPSFFKTNSAKLLTVKQTTHVIRYAMIEGAAFFGCIAFIVERNPLVLGVVGVAILAMLLMFPTESGVRAWIAQQEKLIDPTREGTYPPIRPR